MFKDKKSIYPSKTVTSILGAAMILVSLSLFAQPDPMTNRSLIEEKKVSVYLLIDTTMQLETYVNDLSKIKKPNFNRVIFSFVRPTIMNYESGNLAYTGILGYFDQGDGLGKASFEQLKAAIKLSKEKSIETFLSVGGWNYSCNNALYGEKCGDPGMNYDYFPDPNDPEEASLAKMSYQNLVSLSNDLGIDGLDFDYEEFWHADAYADSFSGEPWATELAEILKTHGGPTYDNLMKYATGKGSTFVMPKTVDKMAAILHEIIDNPAASKLHLATAAPAVGARPITGFVYGDNKDEIHSKGGVWWKGNLKGIWYHLANKDKDLVSRFEQLALMTYDLCGDNAVVCAPYGDGPLDLSGQVNAYMSDYQNWLKADKESEAQLTISNTGKVDFYPAKYHIKSQIQFGFEVNQPAYPKNTSGQLQLTKPLVDKILNQQRDSGGVIIWQMYSKQNRSITDATTSKYTIQQSCKTFLSGDNRYDCSADFPSDQ
jgi:chitinase